MARAVFRLSDFVLSLLLLFVGLNLCLPSGDFHIAELAAGISFALLGVLVLVFSFSSRLWSWSRLYLPRVLLYSALFVVLVGDFIHRFCGANGPLEKGDGYPVAIGVTFIAIFLACNAIGYAFWGRRTTKLQGP
jgi:hypothetical protein